MGKFSGGKFGGIHLLDQQIAAVLQDFQVDADVLHACEQQAKLFIEDEQGRFLASGDGSGGKNHRDQRLASAGRAEDQRA
ncbi:hypothetical protein D3C84_701790 [compost metagenome]